MVRNTKKYHVAALKTIALKFTFFLNSFVKCGTYIIYPENCQPKKMAEWVERDDLTPKVAGSNTARLALNFKKFLKKSEPGGIRTCDLQWPGIMRCPLGHTGYGIFLW